ncbi:MAG: EutN/CcmL family microcompartment protein [Gemmatimonadetes bacterium]|nr:EutN/CcmL family microcompartment protein [Gemmatimonadota bacterium]
MTLCRVVGEVISTHKNEHLIGQKLLLVQPLTLEGEAEGGDLIALDVVDAGVGDTVLVMREGGSARIVLADEDSPVQAVIVGVVDRIDFLPAETR